MNYRISQKVEIIILWNRLINMDDERIPKVIFNWDYNLGSSKWCKSVMHIVTECGLQQNYETKICVNRVETNLSAAHETEGRDNLHKT